MQSQGSALSRNALDGVRVAPADAGVVHDRSDHLRRQVDRAVRQGASRGRLERRTEAEQPVGRDDACAAGLQHKRVAGDAQARHARRKHLGRVLCLDMALLEKDAERAHDRVQRAGRLDIAVQAHRRRRVRVHVEHGTCRRPAVGHLAREHGQQRKLARHGDPRMHKLHKRGDGARPQRVAVNGVLGRRGLVRVVHEQHARQGSGDARQRREQVSGPGDVAQLGHGARVLDRVRRLVGQTAQRQLVDRVKQGLAQRLGQQFVDLLDEVRKGRDTERLVHGRHELSQRHDGISHAGGRERAVCPHKCRAWCECHVHAVNARLQQVVHDLGSVEVAQERAMLALDDDDQTARVGVQPERRRRPLTLQRARLCTLAGKAPSETVLGQVRAPHKHVLGHRRRVAVVGIDCGGRDARPARSGRRAHARVAHAR
eukprot:Unigene1097_Nuclearia_a/m.3490 Unigene1097_Nuclearia_a/g.3490  ORF Unigene1097_Nuclearia_a/g.3490 Unigene1097_Nuclearia_a/m.3490 type:complete len:428 (-) Unigene1097_Nuclearia_a:205-1488(-)